MASTLSPMLNTSKALSNSYFDEVCGCSKLEFSEYNVGVWHQGTGVQNFVFNRLDYLLWPRVLAGDSLQW